MTSQLPSIHIEKKLQLTSGERLYLKLNKKRPKKFIVSMMKDDRHTQVDLRFDRKPLP